MNKTKIAWADFTWNPITGCTAVSAGCANCYAKAVHERFYDTPFGEIVLRRKRLYEPMKRKKPAMIFVGSMTDLFHDDVSFGYIDRVINTIASSPQHTFQILTKRPDRMKEYFTGLANGGRDIGHRVTKCCGSAAPHLHRAVIGYRTGEALKNLWLGVTAENQETADERIPILLDTPAENRFVSIEPMIGGVNLKKLHRKMANNRPAYPCSENYLFDLDWVIVGGESGAKSKVRPMKYEWVQQVYEDCVSSNVPFFFKQWGAHVPEGAGSFDFESVKEFPDD